MLRVYVAAENQLLLEALARMLTKKGNLQVVALKPPTLLDREAMLPSAPDVILLTSGGCVDKEVEWIQQVRTWEPKIRILVIGVRSDQGEFFSA